MEKLAGCRVQCSILRGRWDYEALFNRRPVRQAVHGRERACCWVTCMRWSLQKLQQGTRGAEERVPRHGFLVSVAQSGQKSDQEGSVLH